MKYEQAVRLAYALNRKVIPAMDIVGVVRVTVERKAWDDYLRVNWSSGLNITSVNIEFHSACEVYTHIKEVLSDLCRAKALGLLV